MDFIRVENYGKKLNNRLRNESDFEKITGKLRNDKRI